MEIFTSWEQQKRKIDSQKLLGVVIDHKLNFEERIKTIAQTVGKKLNALTTLSCLVAPYQLKLIFNLCIKGKFHYYPLIQMFSLIRANNPVNKIHEKTLRPIHNNYENRFNGLLKINNRVAFHDLRNCRHFRSKLGHWNESVYCTPLDRLLKMRFNEGTDGQLFTTKHSRAIKVFLQPIETIFRDKTTCFSLHKEPKNTVPITMTMKYI